MNDDECIHGLGPVSACTICNGRDRQREAAEAWQTFPAAFAGQCPECDLPIHTGDIVAWKPDHRAVHERCAP